MIPLQKKQLQSAKDDFKKVGLKETEKEIDALRTVQRNFGQTGAESVRRALNVLGQFFPDLPPTFRLSALRERKYCPSMDDVQHGITAVFDQRRTALEEMKEKYESSLDNLADGKGEELKAKLNTWYETQKTSLDELENIYQANATRWHLRTRFRMRKYGTNDQSIGLTDFKNKHQMKLGEEWVRYRSRLRFGKASQSISVKLTGDDTMDVTIYHHRWFLRDLNKKDIQFMLMACRDAGKTTITPTGFNLARRREIVREALKAGFTVVPTPEDRKDRVISSLLEDYKKVRSKYQGKTGAQSPSPEKAPKPMEVKGPPALRPRSEEMQEM